MCPSDPLVLNLMAKLRKFSAYCIRQAELHMKKETVLLVVIILLVALLGGIIFTNANKKVPVDNQAVGNVPSIDYQQHIKHLKELLAREPNNRSALVQLGHSYFDSNQPMQAIEAYDKALELDGNDPDVLTDQGIMYRRVGWFGKAIDNFQQARKLNPQHLQSLYNMGIVFRDDLQDKEKAKEAWSKYLEIAPAGKATDQVRTMIDHMENGH
jgi:tetratricopeptide (TPR) repeat protein